MERVIFFMGSVSGAIAVALGAFGAHGLRARLSADQLQTFETAVRYQMYHALALMVTAYAASRWQASRLPGIAGWLFAAGTLLFSGSLYLLVFSENRLWGAITPLGGVAFIAGWLCLAFLAFSK